MWLIAGLGNPGLEYDGTRHNIGAAAVERIVSKYSFAPGSGGPLWTCSKGAVSGHQILAVRPLAYMNDSGSALSAALSSSNAKEILVIHDDIALQLGQMRVKFGGSDAGHNGIKSIDRHIGHNYWRVRLGVGHPGLRSGVIEHVLGKFGESEQAQIDQMLTCLADALPSHLAGNPEAFKQALAKAAPLQVLQPRGLEKS